MVIISKYVRVNMEVNSTPSVRIYKNCFRPILLMFEGSKELEIYSDVQNSEFRVFLMGLGLVQCGWFRPFEGLEFCHPTIS